MYHEHLSADKITTFVLDPDNMMDKFQQVWIAEELGRYALNCSQIVAWHSASPASASAVPRDVQQVLVSCDHLDKAFYTSALRSEQV